MLFFCGLFKGIINAFYLYQIFYLSLLFAVMFDSNFVEFSIFFKTLCTQYLMIKSISKRQKITMIITMMANEAK